MIELVGFWGMALIAAAVADEAEQKNNLVVCALLVFTALALGGLGAWFAFEEMLGK